MIKVLVSKKGWTTVAYDQNVDLSITIIENENRYQLKTIGAEPSDFEITLTDDPYIVYIKRKGESDKQQREYIPEEWDQEEEKRTPLRPMEEEVK